MKIEKCEDDPAPPSASKLGKNVLACIGKDPLWQPDTTRQQADDRISELRLSHGIGGNMANMMMRNYLLAQNLTPPEGSGAAPMTATLFLVQQHHNLPPRRPQAEVGGLPAEFTNAPFKLMDPLGSSDRVSRYTYSPGRLPKGPPSGRHQLTWMRHQKLLKGTKPTNLFALLAWSSENTTEEVTVTLHGFLVADPDDNVYTDKQNLAIDVAAYNPVLWIVSTQADPKTMLYASDTYAEEHYALTRATAEQITWSATNDLH